ncbi:MAG TPA: NTP transferase domain-containing protein [Dermatophilaceae bacterium]|nr:NTP transferase domain-containing protein [Dermatophilaceae bacterium]
MEPSVPPTTAVIILTGGGSTRMGRHKPALEVGDRPMIARVLSAAAEHVRVVVGHPEGVPAGTPVVREEPPGTGPVAGIAAGLAALGELTAPDPIELVGVLAGDLPFLTAEHLDELFVALTSGPTDIERPEVALAVDPKGTANWLCAVWRAEALRRRLAELGDPEGKSVRRLLDGTRQVHVLDETGWSTDVDTPDDLDSARNRQP